MADGNITKDILYVGDDVAEEGIKYLPEINFKDRTAVPVTLAAE
jgi:hypothetical protein